MTLPQMAASTPTAVKHLLPFFSGVSSPELREDKIFVLSRNSYFSNPGKVLDKPCGLDTF